MTPTLRPGDTRAERPDSGRSLSRDYYRDVVRPLLEEHAPGLPHAAARLGSGSDVLGFDDETSRDHDWGLRLTLLVEDDRAEKIDALLERKLPRTWRGHPTRFATTWDPVVRHRAETVSARGFASSRLGVDPARHLTVEDWRSLTGQAVLEVLAGPVFHDGPGVITAIRETLTWYPHDLWLYALACDWSRLGDEFADVGRSGLRGDEDGSAVIAARHVRTMMHLAHLIHRRWAPYGKWLGRSAAALPDGELLREAWTSALRSGQWRSRQESLAGAAELLARAQGAAGLPTLARATEAFFARPHIGVREGMTQRLLAAIGDPEVRALPHGHGTAEQISDNVTVLVDAAARRNLVR